MSGWGAWYVCTAMTIGLVLIITLVCMSMGGWYFLAAQVCGFTAVVQLFHGGAVAYAVSTLVDSFQ